MNGTNLICGFDFGTSNTSVAVKDASGTLVCFSFPSAIFFDFEAKETLYGERALDSFYELIPGRLLTSFKSILGSKNYDSGTLVYGQQTSYESIITDYIKFVKQQVEQQIGAELSTVISGRPVHFVDEQKTADDKAQSDLERIFLNSGFKRVYFEFEPIAATESFLSDHPSLDKIVLTLDIGGGTSDFCLFQPTNKQADTNAIMNTAGLHIGGDDFDKNLCMYSVMPLLGLNSYYKSKPDIKIANNFFLNMSSWNSIHNQYKNKHIQEVVQLSLQVSDNKGLHRLIRVMKERTGHQILNQVENAKIALSDQEITHIDLDFVESDLSLTLSQDDLNQALLKTVNKINLAIETLLSEAQLDQEAIGYVVCTGGTTLVPTLKNSLYNIFGQSRIIQHDTFSAVAKGLYLRADKILKATIRTS